AVNGELRPRASSQSSPDSSLRLAALAHGSQPQLSLIPSMADSPYDCFSICAPGLEELARAELAELSITGPAVTGGGEWRGSPASVALANLWSRIASRVIVRIGRFHARTFFELERHANKIPWDRYVVPGAPIRFRVTCRKSKLYHSDAVAQRLFDAAAR